MSTKLSGSALQEKRQKADESPSAAHTVQRLKLELILQHVGAGDWYYIALVNKRWCTFYRPICEDDAKLQKTWTIVQGRRRFTRPICATFTNLSSALASPSRLVWAWSLGLSLAHKDVSMRAGICASRATIQAGEARGLQLNQAICEGAASAGRLP
jgi:hypothetical protein